MNGKLFSRCISAVCITFVALSCSAQSKVYMTRDISAEGLVRIYEALGVKAEGKVCVKISTGESAESNQLKPELIKQLVRRVNGTLVECCTAYGGNRQDVSKHWAAVEERGYKDVATVDLMDEYGEMRIPVKDSTHIKADIVGNHLRCYDYMINLAHFKGHTMGGFGGVLKNASIGVASTNGKAYIHSAGRTDNVSDLWGKVKETPQDEFLESMAAAAQAVHDYFGGKVLYINVMNNLSVDCDCDGHPHAPEMKDVGIFASTDPVALDKACVDLVFNYDSKTGDDAKALQERINTRHGIHTIEHAEKIGLGTTRYQLISIDLR